MSLVHIMKHTTKGNGDIPYFPRTAAGGSGRRGIWNVPISEKNAALRTSRGPCQSAVCAFPRRRAGRGDDGFHSARARARTRRRLSQAQRSTKTHSR
jgi:hypothetical protein